MMMNEEEREKGGREGGDMNVSREKEKEAEPVTLPGTLTHTLRDPNNILDKRPILYN